MKKEVPTNPIPKLIIPESIMLEINSHIMEKVNEMIRKHGSIITNFTIMVMCASLLRKSFSKKTYDWIIDNYFKAEDK